MSTAAYAPCYDLRKKMKIIYQTFFIIITIVILSISCGTDPLTHKDSSDKSKTILVYTKRIGDQNTYISFIDNKNKSEEKILKLNGFPTFSFEWINNSEINIYIQYKNQIMYLNKDLLKLK